MKPKTNPPQFSDFDPLAAKQSLQTEVAINAMKRELKNILDSYVGWFDPFAELIQNALDSVEQRADREGKSYSPQIRILIDLAKDGLTVTDNGVGLDQEQYSQFLAPSFSFKTGKTRGHKGVGATYLAYGTNSIQISTRTDSFEACGRMQNARNWLYDANPAANPKVRPDARGPRDTAFQSFDRGVSISVDFDKSTTPSDLSWLKAKTAEQWLKILSLKTGLGAIFPNKKIRVFVRVTAEDGSITKQEAEGISYLWPHQEVKKARTLRTIAATEEKLFKKHGTNYRLPNSIARLDAIYDTITPTELPKLLSLDDTELAAVKTHKPTLYFCYMYSAKVWQALNSSLQVRAGQSIFQPGIQIAANNMPQGEVIQIPLTRNVGRQNQVLVVIHFENSPADLGRKGFQKEIVDFAKEVSRKLVDRPLQKVMKTLRPVTGVRRDLEREDSIDAWKEEMAKHEKDCPLELINENFFLPTKQVSITSVPTREQDVIALFNQLLAGGVIRGVRVMSTNERFTYDGMYRVVLVEPTNLHIYDRKRNPLGILAENIPAKLPFQSRPKILEYKFSLDALIEDCSSGLKNSNEVGLVVVWETGSDYEGNYHVTSMLDEDNVDQREYHGVTHIMTNLSTGQREMDLIVLSELVDHLNDAKASTATQREKYDTPIE